MKTALVLKRKEGCGAVPAIDQGFLLGKMIDLLVNEAMLTNDSRLLANR